MKIAFINLKGNSGSDIYYKTLKKSLDKYVGINSKIFFLPSFLEKIPFLIPFYLKKLDLNGFDIIHTNVEFAYFFKIKGKKLVTTVHHINFDKVYQKYTSFFQKIYHYLWIYPIMKYSLRKTDLNIAVSNFTKESCKRVFKGDYKIETIYNGIDTDLFKKINVNKENKKYRLLFIGNQSKRKGWDLVIETMKRLGDNYELYYAGLRDNKGKELEKYNIFCLGKLSHEELVVEYNKANVFLFPTRLEGFGYSVAESITCGTPVVTTNYSAIPEIVKDGVNGYLCNINDIDCFVKKVKFIIKNKPFENKNISKTVQQFNFKNLALNYEKAYISIMKK